MSHQRTKQNGETFCTFCVEDLFSYETSLRKKSLNRSWVFRNVHRGAKIRTHSCRQKTKYLLPAPPGTRWTNVSESHSLLLNNSFSIYLFCKYTKGIGTEYSLYMCKTGAYFLPLVAFIAGILCCTLCKNNQINGVHISIKRPRDS